MHEDVAPARFALQIDARVVVWPALVVSLVFLIFVAGSYGWNAALPARVAGQLSVGAVIVGWGIAFIRNPWWRPRSVLAGPVLACLVVMALSAIASPHPRLGLGAVITAGAIASGFLVLVRLAAHPWFGPRVRSLVIVIPLALGLAYLSQVLALWIEWWSLVGRVTVPPLRPGWVSLGQGSPNIVATFMLLTSPVAAALLATRNGTRRGVAAAIATLALGLVVVVLTGSRGAMLGAAGALAIAVTVAVARSARRHRTVQLAILAIGGGVTAAVALVLLGRMSQGGTDVRFEFWRASLQMLIDRPVLGVGPGGWALARLDEWQPWVPTAIVPHAHNFLFQTLAELGVMGGVAVLALGVSALRMHVRVMRAGGREGLVAASSLLALLAVGLQSTVDVVTHVPGVALAVALIVAIAEPADGRVGSGTTVGFGRRTQQVVMVGGAVALVAAATWAVRSDFAMSRAHDAVAALLAGDPAGAAREFDAATSLDPLPLYEIERAVALAHAKDPAARTALAESVALEPLPHHLVALADAALAEGDAEGAVSAAREALERGWPDPNIMVNVGRIAERAGDRSLAAEAYARGAARAPTTLSDPFWRTLSVVSYDQLIDRAAEIAREHPVETNLALILAFAGRAVDARAAIALAPPDEQPALRGVVLARQDLSAGLAVLRDRLRSEPLDWLAAAWLARLLRESGRVDEAATYERWGWIVQDWAEGVRNAPRHFAGSLAADNYRGSGTYPWPIYFRGEAPVLFGPDAVVAVP